MHMSINDIPDCDGHIHMYVHTYIHHENRSLIQSLALMRLALGGTYNMYNYIPIYTVLPHCVIPCTLLCTHTHSGVHHTKVCNKEKDAKKVIDKLNSQKSSLFPSSLLLDSGLNL